MKILFIASGDSIHSKKWVSYFASRKHEIVWLSSALFNIGTIPGAKNYLIQGNIINRWRKIKKIIAEFKPDIVHAHYAGYNGLFGMLSGFHPFILTAWGSDVLINRKSIWKKIILKAILKSADVITCDANHLKKAMVDLGAIPDRIQIIRFGIDTERFKPATGRADLKEKLGITGPAVISLRSFEPIYDLESLIRAVPLVIKEIPGVNFVVAGKGSLEDKLKSLAVSLSVSGKIKFIGMIPNEDLSDYLRLAKVYVSTSLSDAGIASSTAEAMACGLPVVVTDSGENRDWVKDNQNGFVVPMSDPAALAERIIYLLRNEKKAKDMGEWNIAAIKDKNDYWRQMEMMERVYLKLIKK